MTPWLGDASLDFGTVDDDLQALESIINEMVFLAIALRFRAPSRAASSAAAHWPRSTSCAASRTWSTCTS
ncbi:MAG TPA: hypothetical protein VF981_13535 [Gemmatimonadaceae bacterium]